MVARSSSWSSESWMPMETPDAIGLRLPPSVCQSGWPFCFAWRSHAAISMTALAMLWPRTRAIHVSSRAVLAVLLRMEVPRRHFDDRLGHVMAADARHRRPEIARMREVVAQ